MMFTFLCFVYIFSGVLIPASPVLGGRNTSSMVHVQQSDCAVIVPAPAEILLGLSPTLEHQQNTSKTNYHQLKRALPTTIESFPDEVKFHAEAAVKPRVIYDRVRNRKNYFEITTFLNYEQGSSWAGNSKSNENKNVFVFIWCFEFSRSWFSSFNLQKGGNF